MSAMDGFWRDLRYAARSIGRTRTITAAAVVTLALGIGAVTTIFSLFQAVLLRQLPVALPGQLYFVAHGTGDDLSTSSHYPWFEQVSQLDDVLAGVTAYNMRDFKVSVATGIETAAGQYASANYHALLGVPFALGRGFNEDDARARRAVAVISDAYWSRHFGRGRDVLGRTLIVGGRPAMIAGVTAPQFAGMQPGRRIDVTLPLWIRIDEDPEFLTRTDTWTSMPLVARLRAGVAATDAGAAVASAYRAYMSLPANREFSRGPGGQLRAATLVPAARGADRLRREYERPLQVLMGMVAAVLLIACVNVANLLLARAPARAREVAVRMSVGASRSRIVRLLLLESVLLAVLGGALGVLLAVWSTDFVSDLLGTGMRPIVVDVQPDRVVLIFATAVSLITGVVFGLAPALRTTGIDLPLTLKVGGTAAGSRRRRFGQHGLVAVQVALSLVLVFGAALLGRTLQNLRTMDAGFHRDAVVLFELDTRDTPFPPERLEALCTNVVSRLTARPEVLSGSCSTMSPIATNTEGRPISVPGFAPGPADPPFVFANSVDPEYFRTFGIEFVRGQGFTAADTAASRLVAVLGQTTARHYFGDADPIGRTFSFGRGGPGPPITIVGVVRDARQQLRTALPHMVYTPLSQRREPARGLLAAIATAGPTAGVAAAVREELRALTPDAALAYVRTMEEQIGAALVGERLLAVLSASFALLALLLACVGLYGVTSGDVARRSRDIGIRLALGARRAQVLGQILRQASAVTSLGVGVGAVAAIAATRTLSSLLYGIPANDLTTLFVSTALLMATALTAAYLPARRASRLDPAITLRAE